MTKRHYQGKHSELTLCSRYGFPRIKGCTHVWDKVTCGNCLRQGPKYKADYDANDEISREQGRKPGR